MAAARAVPRRRAARERARISLHDGRREPRRRNRRRHQPDPPRRRPRARHPPHGLPDPRHRRSPRRAARGPRSRHPRRSPLRRRVTRLARVDRALQGRGCAPHRGRSPRDLHADLHVGDDGRAEGRDLLLDAHGDGRQGPRADARTHLEGRRLPRDAALPFERPHGRRRPDHGRGRRLGHAPQVLRERLPPRRPEIRRHLLQLRRQAAHLRARDPGEARRRRQHPARRLRQRGRGPRSRAALRSASAARSSTPTARPRAALRSRVRRACPPAPSVSPRPAR